MDLSVYKEKASHGDAFMPVRHYRCSFSGVSQAVPLHWHEEAEIARIEEGEAEYGINLEKYPVRRGDLILISPHILHSVGLSAGGSMASDSLVFHPDMLGCGVGDACTLKYIKPVRNGRFLLEPVARQGEKGYDELSGCFSRLLSAFDSGEEGFELETKGLLFHFFSLLYRDGRVRRREDGFGDPEREEKLKAVLTYIRNHYQEPIAVADLSNLCHFSETYFMSFFKRLAGTTCTAYINDYRLSVAASLLAGTNTPVMEAAMDCGFRNISYFNRLFRTKFGMTPGDYRRKEQE